MDLHERIALVVKESGLTKTAFAEQLNLSQPYVSHLCTGNKTPSDRTIIDICRKFNVSLNWLRDGEGEMYLNPSKKGEVLAVVGDIMRDDSDDRQKLISVLTRMTPEETALLLKMAEKLVEEMKNAGP